MALNLNLTSEEYSREGIGDDIEFRGSVSLCHYTKSIAFKQASAWLRNESYSLTS